MVLTHTIAIHERTVALSDLPRQLAEGFLSVSASLQVMNYWIIMYCTPKFRTKKKTARAQPVNEL
jgi:hypothetical protein